MLGYHQEQSGYHPQGGGGLGLPRHGVAADQAGARRGCRRLPARAPVAPQAGEAARGAAVAEQREVEELHIVQQPAEQHALGDKPLTAGDDLHPDAPGPILPGRDGLGQASSFARSSARGILLFTFFPFFLTSLALLFHFIVIIFNIYNLLLLPFSCVLLACQ